MIETSLGGIVVRKQKEYLEFEEITANKNRKTKTWVVRNKETQEILAGITWRSGWRKYVVRFASSKQIDFDHNCLWQLTNFLNNAMLQYIIRKEQANGKAKKTSKRKVSERK